MKKLLFILIVNSTLLIANCFSQPITWEKVMMYNTLGVFYKAQQTSDGDYIAAGINRIGIYYKMYIAKFNKYGDTLWTRYYNLSLNYDYEAYWIEETYDRGFIIGGSGLTAGLLKTDSLGVVQWYRSLTDGWQTRCVKQTTDLGYILGIWTDSYGPTSDIMIVKTDSLGNTVWSKVFRDDNAVDYVQEIKAVGNYGYVAVGTKWPLNDSADVYLMRLNLNGDTLWTKVIGGSRGDAGYSIDTTDDGGFIIGGSTFSFNTFGYLQSYIVKTDSNGNVQWQRAYAAAFNDECFSIRVIPNMGYAFCGSADSSLQNYERAFIRIIDFSGNILRERFYRKGDESNRFYSLERTTDSGFILSGYANYVIPGTKAYIVRTDSLGNVEPIGININNNEIPVKFIIHQNFPNPFNAKTIIKVEVKSSAKISLILYDVTGRRIKKLIDSELKAGTYNININAEELNLASGIYFYTLYINNSINSIITKKMVYLK